MSSLVQVQGSTNTRSGATVELAAKLHVELKLEPEIIAHEYRPYIQDKPYAKGALNPRVGYPQAQII